LLVTINRGEIIKSGDVKIIPREGMPTYKNPFDKGNLFIHFSIEFPEKNWIPNDKLAQLAELLPKNETIADADCEEAEMTDFDPSQHSSSNGNRSNAYDEDDEEGHGGGPRVQCAQQ